METMLAEDLDALSRRYRPALNAFFRKRVRDRNEAEDLTQDVFAALARRAELDTVRNIEGYLFQVAVNLLRYRARTAMRRPEIAFEGSADPQQRLIEERSPERIGIAAEDWRRVVQALHELPERRRTIFILNRFEHLTGPEIARRLDCSLSLVEKEMTKAVSHVRKVLS